MPRRWEYWIYPELRKFRQEEQDLVLRKAKDSKMDGFEIMGMALAVALTVALTRYSNVGLALLERIGAALANLLIAIPVLPVFGAPFYVRRVRRALKAQIDEHQR